MPRPPAPVPKLPGAEKRRSPRRRPRGSAPVSVFVQPDYRARVGALHNLSAGGAAVLLRGMVEVGDLLFVQLPGRRDGRTRTVAGRVIHRKHIRTGGWLVGCRWQSPLTDEDVRQALLAFR
jgi:hypothetical protein